MTREEKHKAIDALKISAPIMAMTQEEFNDYIQTLNEVMDWLEQEPCEDAISRQTVIEIFGYVMDYWKEHAIDVEPHEIKDALIEQYEFTAKQLSELPSVTPQQKTGHWIRGHHGFGCSNCHKSIEGEWDDNIDDITGTLFCPNCGARMVEKQESEKNNAK